MEGIRRPAETKVHSSSEGAELGDPIPSYK
ncbi:MAG: hypothetical protein HW403_1363, partial [Dehalococcoidia bacterium]|nr:hypothetical protein [Dehalococcoidia bacterium]